MCEKHSRKPSYFMSHHNINKHIEKDIYSDKKIMWGGYGVNLNLYTKGVVTTIRCKQDIHFKVVHGNLNMYAPKSILGIGISSKVYFKSDNGDIIIQVPNGKLHFDGGYWDFYAPNGKVLFEVGVESPINTGTTIVMRTH